MSAAAQPGHHALRGSAMKFPAAGDLVSVSAVTPTDAWAIGFNTEILHWNGGNWSRVNSSSPRAAVLNAVSADSGSDAWAVGFYTRSTGSPAEHTLTEHWNGKAWSVVRSPVLGYLGTQLFAVTALSRNDAWAVGQYCAPQRCFNSGVKSQTLILHWNGIRWTRVTSPSPCGGNNSLAGVAAVSASAAWAVGSCTSATTASTRPLLLRWNGVRWSAAMGPDLHTAVNYVSAVTGVSASDAWAVGDHYLADGLTQTTLILHWNGRTWSRVPSPDPGVRYNILTGASAVSASDVWVTGFGGVGQGATLLILTLRWNGNTWSQVPNTAGAIAGPLAAVSADRPDDAWIVGPPMATGCSCPLAIHWNGVRWSQSP
ncbi:MAG TPA: hypothetical protein VF834_25300 [Streptosporangiaceae bacterium]